MISLENEKYAMEVKEFHFDSVFKSEMNDRFLLLKELMKIILQAFDKAGSAHMIDLEIISENTVKEWFSSFQLKMLRFHADQGNAENENVSNTCANLDTQLKVLPNISVWIEELVFGGKLNERKKRMTLDICLDGVISLEVKFLIEKKRFGLSLQHLAAAKIVKDLDTVDFISFIKVPTILKQILVSTYYDIDWTRSFWSLNTDIEMNDSDQI